MKHIPEEKLRQICSGIDGQYGLYVSLPEEGEVLQLHSDTVLYAASTIKIPILALLLKDFEEGRLDPNATAGYWAALTQDAVAGRYVKLTVESRQALALIGEISVGGTVYTQSDNSNIAMGKTMVVTGYAGSPFTALLNDGLASDVFQHNVNNSSWFAFRNTGDATTGNVTLDSHRGIVTVNLGGQAEITAVRVHLLGGENDIGALQPDHINVYFSNDGSWFDYMGYCILERDADGAYWAVLDRSASPVSARYVKLAVGVNAAPAGRTAIGSIVTTIKIATKIANNFFICFFSFRG